MAFEDLLHRSAPRMAEPTSRQNAQSLEPMATASSAAIPRSAAEMTRQNTPSPPADLSLPRGFTPPHMRDHSERRNHTTPNPAPNADSRFAPPPTVTPRRQTVNSTSRPPSRPRNAPPMQPLAEYQNGRLRGPSPSSSSSSSSGENRLFGRPHGEQSNPHVRNGGGPVPFDRQRAAPNGPIQYTASQPREPVNPAELYIWANGFPPSCTAADVYKAFSGFGNISRIGMVRLNPMRTGANITFRPAPKDVSWAGMRVQYPDAFGNIRWIETKDETKRPSVPTDPNAKRPLPKLIMVPVECVDFGVMETDSAMLGMHSLKSTAAIEANLVMDLNFNAIFLSFPVRMAFRRTSGKQEVNDHEFRMKMIPAQIRDGRMTTEQDSSVSLYFTCETPPVVHRKTLKPLKTFNDKQSEWNDNALWLRQTSIDVDPHAPKSSVKLREKGCIIDLGRWLTYRLNISQATFRSPEFQDLMQALANHNINMSMDKDTQFRAEDVEDLWEWLDSPVPQQVEVDDNPFLAEMHQMADNSVQLPFAVRYQLEVCLSLGLLHECNMSRSFLDKLGALDPARAVKILEKVADDKKKYFNPEDIKRLQNRVSIVEKKRPSYCTKILSAVVTPTTIYFATPVLETSNRVIRQFQHFEDRFLRVKFTDERHKGKLFSQDDRNEDEVFSRVSRAMTEGITIGDRHYEFLAFGSSQFRENGAYFFASTNSLTAEMIRKWMGNFTKIKVVAKYCARLGQCFSTTRAIPHSVTIEKITDVVRNGHCFTDGAGKISPLLARIIADNQGLKNSEEDYPSMFQFRCGGVKGVLAVDPSLKGRTIQIRPSQEKFPAQFQGLEICRISQYSTAYLNQQIILVLSALGVPAEVFVKKMKAMMSDFDKAMEKEQKALELLQKNIDLNQMTIALAGMVYDGFMKTQEPFMLSCLRLWRSWTLKYLKEKARICVEKGAFVLAGPDETGSLKGDFKTRMAADETGTLKDGGDEAGNDSLPEIFLQIPDPDHPGKYKVVEEECIIARNPSLHPGDVRKVRAVDTPALRHMKDVLIMPVTGYRDLANMCSGGDLDGDDFMVIWDKELFPTEPDHPPMDYTGPTPTEAEGAVTAAHMAKFFVLHIKNDNLPRIATTHKYWADQLDDGLKNPICIRLAELHSMAVDYAKTGVPAEVPLELRVKKFPHWAERKNTSANKIYTSRKVLGKLYDEVKSEAFLPAWDLPFDERILSACEPSEQMLQGAREIKALYDESLRRIMTQYGIKTEFEVFTTFVLAHHQDLGDYKLGETMGKVSEVLTESHRDLCYEKAGTDSKTKDWAKLKPFLVAMYKITAEEISHAYAETNQTTQVGGRDIPVRPLGHATMPFMSFPWIFMRELGQIATKGDSKPKFQPAPRPTIPKKQAAATKQLYDLLGDDFAPEPLPEVNTGGAAIRKGDLLDLFHDEGPAVVPSPKAPEPEKEAWPESIREEQLRQGTAASIEAESEVMRKARMYQQAGLPSTSSTSLGGGGDLLTGKVDLDEIVEGKEEMEAENADDEREEGEEVKIEFDEKPSRLDQLVQLVGADS